MTYFAHITPVVGRCRVFWVCPLLRAYWWGMTVWGSFYLSSPFSPKLHIEKTFRFPRLTGLGCAFLVVLIARLLFRIIENLVFRVVFLICPFLR